MSLLRYDLDFHELAEIIGQVTGVNVEAVGQDAISEAGGVLLNRIRKRFLAQVDPEGKPWEPSYAAFLRSFGIGKSGKKLKRGSGGGTLFDTGTLFHSIQLYSVSPLEQSIATDVYYAPYHNEGTGTLPKREFLGFSEEDHLLAANVFMQKITQAMLAAAPLSEFSE